jgi:hypothetical protein
VQGRKTLDVVHPARLALPKGEVVGWLGDFRPFLDCRLTGSLPHSGHVVRGGGTAVLWVSVQQLSAKICYEGNDKRVSSVWKQRCAGFVWQDRPCKL